MKRIQDFLPAFLLLLALLISAVNLQAQACYDCPANPQISGSEEAHPGSLEVYEVAPHNGRFDATSVTWSFEGGRIVARENMNHRITVLWEQEGQHELTVTQTPNLIFPPYLMANTTGEDRITVRIELYLLPFSTTSE